MNIVKLSGHNNGGVKYLLAYNAARLVSGGERPLGHYVNTAICHYSDSPATYIEGVRGEVEFTETPELIEGAPAYRSSAKAIIPKDRPEIMDMFQKWDKRRFVVLVPDKNGKVKMVGTREEPAQFIINERSTKPGFDGRNEIEIEFTCIRRHPAYNYTPTTAVVETVGTITIGNRVHTA